MNLAELPEAVQKLAELGDPWALDEDFRYRSAGIRREHIPALIDVVRSTGEWMVDPVLEEKPDETADMEEELPAQFWLPMHAWRALGQLEAVEAAPAMLDALRLIDDSGSEMVSDIVQDDLPIVLSSLGPKIIPQVAEYLLDEHHGLWARLSAGETLNKIGLNQPEARGEVVQHFIQALEDFEAEEPVFNSFIISHLMDLKAVEAAELVEQVFASERIDEDVMGDWEDFQVGVGLLKERLTPPKSFNFDPFAGERTGAMDFLRGRSREDKKTKKKRKQAKETRKKNRKRKKR
jgi:hypothetical protein